MISPNTPYNNLPLLPPRLDYDDPAILKLVNKANIALSKLNGQTTSTFSNFSNAMLLAKTFSVREAVDSSGVENVITTVREALESRALPVDEMTAAEKETNMYTRATYGGSDILRKKGYLATNDFIKIQKLLGLADSGIRKNRGYVIANEKTKEIYYTPPEGEKLIRDLLMDLENYFNDKDEDPDALIKMAILHYQFEAIHPFPDGNGRTGRILMALYLMAQDRLDYPVLFLSDYILNHRDEYYQRLRDVTYESKWSEWITYMLNAVIEQANKTAQALTNILALSLRYEKKLPKEIPAFSTAALIGFLFTKAVFTREQMAAELDVHVNTASKYLNLLVKAKLISYKKHKNTKVFFIPEFVTILTK
jgi:Fic family protein